jgi:hypothetical protein
MGFIVKTKDTIAGEDNLGALTDWRCSDKSEQARMTREDRRKFSACLNFIPKKKKKKKKKPV